MTYKTLLTIVTDPAVLETQLAQACDMATSCKAHLDVVCLGIDATQTAYAYAGVSAAVVQDNWSRAREDGDALAAQARKVMERTDLSWGVEAAAGGMEELSRIAAHRARFADLVISPRPYGDKAGGERVAVLEGAMFAGQAPVLVMPDKAKAPTAPSSVIVAWNQSGEALTATRRALPILTAADLVRIVVIDPPAHGPDRSDPGGLLAQMLARHGAKCEIDVLNKSMDRVSEILNRHVMDTGADMVVMGAYGHSRFREAILGGATRNMLEHARVPVLMAH